MKRKKPILTLLNDDPEIAELLKRRELSALAEKDELSPLLLSLKKVFQGAEGYTPEFGKDFLTPKEMEAIKEELRPKKFQDYFTEEEIEFIAQGVFKATVSELKAGLKEELTPKKGVDYRDGIDGKDADDIDISALVSVVLKEIPKAEQVDLKGLATAIESNLSNKVPTVESIVKEIKDKRLIELRDIKGARLDNPKGGYSMNDQRWHGGGLSNITGLVTAGTNVTITGTGTSTDPYVINSSGGAGGIASINADTTSAQVLDIGTAGTDFAIVDNGTGTHTFNLPTASATNRGALSSADWTTFNNKGSGTVTSVSGTANRITSTGGATPVLDISGSYVGQTSITTLGTIATGTWEATDVGVAHGGTGVSSISALSIWAANSANVLVEITPGAGNSIRINAGGTAWEAYTPAAGATPGGSDTQVQFNDSSAFGGDSGFTYNKTSNVVSINGAGSGQIGALNITRGDSVNQYIVLTESASSTGSAYLTFAGSNPGAMAMGALYTAGVPTSYVFTNTGGTPILSIAESTGLVNIPSLTASEIVITDASKNLVSAAVATYPSLTELTYVKGVTSSIQTQLNAKGAGTVTTVGFTGGLISVANATTTPALTVAGTDGGVPYFSSTSTWASSGLLAANALMIGGGAGAAPATITTGTGVITALGVNVGSAGAFVTFNGALGTPSSGTVTNLTGTASININGTVGATTPTTGVFTTLVAGSTTSLLLGTAGSAVGNIGFRNATSGTITLEPVTGALGTVTLSLPAATDQLVGRATTDTLTNKRITKRTGTTTSSATPTINTDNVDEYYITAQTEAITSFTTNLSGTPTLGQTLFISVIGTAARGITWGASFANGPVALPTTTVTTTQLSVLLKWDGSIWRCYASGSTV